MAEPLPDLKVGVNLVALVTEVLHRNGVLGGTAGRIADELADEFETAASFRDDRNHVWGLLPLYDRAGNGLPFDHRNTAILREAAVNVMMYSPEAVAVFAGVAYPSALREAKIARVLWLGRGGDVVTGPEIFNSIDTVLGLTEAMFVRLQQLRMHEQAHLTDLLTKKKGEYEQQTPPTQGPA